MDNKPVCDEPWGHFAVSGMRRSWLSFCQAIRNRRLNTWARKPLKSMLNGWVDTEIWGLKLRLSAAGNLSEQRLLYAPSGLDRTERLAIQAELKAGGVFVDIGANAGVYSLWVAAMLGDRVAVEAFEPDLNLCTRLQANLSRNNLDGVRLHRFALGEAEGDGFLVRNGTNLGCNRVVTSDAEDGERVQMRTLPEVLRAHGLELIDVLKIDVEGGEVDVLRPMFAQLDEETWPRLIVCELPRHDADVPIAHLLYANGYVLKKHTRMNGLFRKERRPKLNRAPETVQRTSRWSGLRSRVGD